MYTNSEDDFEMLKQQSLPVGGFYKPAIAPAELTVSCCPGVCGWRLQGEDPHRGGRVSPVQ